MMKAQVQRLRIPVRFIDGICEYAFGGKLPLKDGAEAELFVQATSLWDDAFIALMERREVSKPRGMRKRSEMHKLLNEGTALLVCLKTKPESRVSENFQRLLKSSGDFRISTEALHSRMPPNAFLEVTLSGEGLWLETRGTEGFRLFSAVRLPSAISAEPVASLNQAYIKLSDTFETWRQAHTGSIYSSVLYQEQNGTWYPLKILRDKALHRHEHAIARELWETIIRN
jgi:hypothetical protein